MFSEKKGFFLVFLTAIISGFSIFLNKFAVSFSNEFVFTALKNLVVTALVFSAIFLLKEFKNLKALQKKHWFQLAIIGLIGGSIPFTLFFSALKLSSAVNAGFLHKTLFVFATIFAFVFLKEKITKSFLLVAMFLLIANFLMFSSVSSFAFADLLIVIAVLFWAAENVFSKQVLKELSGSIVGFGRMFFGTIFLMLFLLLSNQFQEIGLVNIVQWQWILLTAIALFFYVLTFYNGLKQIPVHKATAILMLGQPITLLLSLFFLGKTISFNEAIGIFLTLLAILMLFSSSFIISFLRSKGFSIARTRN